jgi:hypothetical protein
MSVSGEVSYLSRFMVKFVEIVAAGIATAVSGYLVAHLTGYLPSPTLGSLRTPAAVQVAPSGSAVSTLPHARPGPAAASTDANAQHLPLQQNVDLSATQPARASVNGPEATPSRKPVTAGTSTQERKLRGADPHEAAENKPYDAKSVEAEVRAALAKVDANRPAPPQHVNVPTDSPSPPSAAAPQPPAETLPPTVAAAPRTADVPLQPLQQAAVPPAPAAAVEIGSRPVAAVGSSPPVQSTAPGTIDDTSPPAGVDKALLPPQPPADISLFSALRHLRSDQAVPDDKAPRPPMPVGQ